MSHTDKEQQDRVLFYLREAFEDDPTDPIKGTTEIAEYLEIGERELYDHDQDTGVLWALKERGLVRRYGRPEMGFCWQADGASIKWDKP